MNRRFALVSTAALAVCVLCVSDHPTARPHLAPRIRMRHMTADEIAADPSLEDMARAQEALRLLVESHPRIEISRDLYQLVERDEVTLNFQDALTGERGSFASTIYLPMGDSAVLTLSVSPTMLLDGSASHDLQQMVIYHEYIHIRQVLDGSIPARIFAPHEVEDITEEYLRYRLAAETEAYEAECRFADEIYSDVTLEVCLAYGRGGRQDLREAIALRLTNRPEWEGQEDLIMRVAREP